MSGSRRRRSGPVVGLSKQGRPVILRKSRVPSGSGIARSFGTRLVPGASELPRHYRALLYVMDVAYVKQTVSHMTALHTAALDALNFDWEFRDGAVPDEDLKTFSIVIPWAHGWESCANPAPFHENVEELRRRCAEMSIPVFSAVPHTMGHSAFYDALKAAKLPCPDYGDVPYPVVLRRDQKLSQGQSMFLVETKEQERAVLSEHPELDLRVKYVGVRSMDGLYRKYRCYVAGDSVVPRQLMVGEDWLVTLDRSGAPVSAKENRKFLREEDKARDRIMLEVARAAGSDACAIDFSYLPDGSMVVWELNACYGMAGKGASKKDMSFWAATGMTEQDVIGMEQQLGMVSARQMLFRSMRRNQEDVVAVLWTGGWDSTFRILQLLDDGKEVLPIYLCGKIDNRANHFMEIRAMEDLHPRLAAVGGTLHPTLYVGRPGESRESAAIPTDPWVSARANRIGYGNVGNEAMGNQYESFCRFARSFGKVELCAEVGGRLEKLLRDEIEGDQLKAEPSLVDYEIFRPFRFPLIRITKQDMLAEAKERGYSSILSRTWSCWFPRPDGTPCRRCEMCRRRPFL